MNIIPWRRREVMSPLGVEFDDLFGRFWNGGQPMLVNRLPEAFRGDRPFPAVNVAETEDGYTVTMDCPGLEEKDFQVEVLGSTLIVSGERKWEEKKKGKEYRRVESQYGRFERMIELPENARLAPGEVDASYKKGVLTILIPKAERTPAAKIPVKAG
jgi:HSP20 family protein